MVQGIRQSMVSRPVGAVVHGATDVASECLPTRTCPGVRLRIDQRRGGLGVEVMEPPAPEDVDLLALLAHQIMTPLTLIDASAQRMIRRSDAMDAAEIELRATRIRNATARLSNLVRSLLDRTKLNAGGTVKRQLCSLVQLAGLACDPVRQFQPSRQFTIDAHPSDWFSGDPLLLEQLLAILVCNAAKYSPEHTRIDITGRVTPREVRIAVTDHGIGVPEKDLPRLFTPYFRAENAVGYHGVGLGLHLAGRIAQLHGGSIEIESRLGAGSTFTLSIPNGE